MFVVALPFQHMLSFHYLGSDLKGNIQFIIIDSKLICTVRIQDFITACVCIVPSCFPSFLSYDCLVLLTSCTLGGVCVFGLKWTALSVSFLPIVLQIIVHCLAFQNLAWKITLGCFLGVQKIAHFLFVIMFYYYFAYALLCFCQLVIHFSWIFVFVFFCYLGNILSNSFTSVMLLMVTAWALLDSIFCLC